MARLMKSLIVFPDVGLEFGEEPGLVGGQIVGGDADGGATHGKGVEFEYEPVPATELQQSQSFVVGRVYIVKQTASVAATFNLRHVSPIKNMVAPDTRVVHLKRLVGDDNYRLVAESIPKASDAKPHDIQHYQQSENDNRCKEIIQGDGDIGMI